MASLKDIHLYDIQETADILGLSTRTVYSYLKNGRLTGRKIGGKWKVSEDNLAHFMEPEPGEGDTAATHDN